MFFFQSHFIHKEKYMRVCLILIKLELFYVIEERFYCTHILNIYSQFRCYIEPSSKIVLTKTVLWFNRPIEVHFIVSQY